MVRAGQEGQRRRRDGGRINRGNCIPTSSLPTPSSHATSLQDDKQAVLFRSDATIASCFVASSSSFSWQIDRIRLGAKGRALSKVGVAISCEVMRLSLEIFVTRELRGCESSNRPNSVFSFSWSWCTIIRAVILGLEVDGTLTRIIHATALLCQTLSDASSILINR